MPQKLLIIFFGLTLFTKLWSQEVFKDSVWVSYYKDSLLVNKDTSKYSSLYYKVYKLPSYSKEELNKFQVRPTPYSLQELLELTHLENSYNATEIKGTSLEKSLREYEQFSYPFSAILTSNLAKQLALPTNEPEFIAANGNLALKTNKQKVISTAIMFEKHSRYDSVAIQQRSYLRYRLLDFLIGSYAKKVENIHWVEDTRATELVLCLPYVDYYNNQFLQLENRYKFLTKILPKYQHLENYTQHIKNIKKVSKPLFGLDVNILSSLHKNDWDEEVAYIQNQLSQEFIQGLLSKLPKAARTEVSKNLLEILVERIANLDSIANEYYTIISSHKIVRATHKNDIVVIEKGKDDVKILIFKEKEGKNKSPQQEYLFSESDTKSIWVYGLKGNDYFEVKGKNNAIKIDVIGGKQLDKYEINSGKNITVYDSENQTEVVAKDQAKIYLSKEAYIQEDSIEKHVSKAYRLKPILGANPDDGIFIGLSNQLTINKFKRKPFTQYHELQGIFYTGNAGFKLDYYGELAAIFFKKQLFTHLQFHSPNYSTNFFGFGNNTPNFDDNLGLSYNRVKMSEIQIELGLKDITNKYDALVSLFFEQNRIDPTPDRFVSSETLFFPSDDFFNPKNYVGVNTFFKYKTLHFSWLPNLVVEPSFTSKISVHLNNTQKTIGKLEPELLVKYPLYHEKVKLESTITYQQVIGNEFEFYQAAYLGANKGLRAYRHQRFTGKSAISLSSDLKWNVKEIKSEVLPLQFGMLGGVDAGRVWMPKEQSSLVHISYGAGFWLQSAELLKTSLMAFGSKEGLRFNFRLQFGL